MYDYSPKLYWKWIHISQNEYVCYEEKCPDLDAALSKALKTGTTTEAWAKTAGDIIAASISKDFKSSYIVTSNDYRLFDYIMSNNTHFKQMIYNAQYGQSVYKIL